MVTALMSTMKASRVGVIHFCLFSWTVLDKSHANHPDESGLNKSRRASEDMQSSRRPSLTHASLLMKTSKKPIKKSKTFILGFMTAGIQAAFAATEKASKEQINSQLSDSRMTDSHESTEIAPSGCGHGEIQAFSVFGVHCRHS